ncbi:proline racemase [Purpureocillium lavendulum]|uniref:Proline racemase n=1 Tax=Purpureocillium lavendulum TaxID=1247861 RepID=A0AB34FR71_9HYPO|nr:proline racemase [Purpureocillium lavendulum]
MHSQRLISVIGCHAEGEVGDVIIGGVQDVPGSTMLEKMMSFSSKHDDIRKLLLNEPRGRGSMNVNLLLQPCDPRADAGFITMGNNEYAYMSGSNTICIATVLLETGILPMKEPETKLSLDTAAGLVSVTAQCDMRKCKSVSFQNVPAFVGALDFPIYVDGIGNIHVDVAFGGMWYAIVDAASIGLQVENAFCAKLVQIGNKILRCVQRQFEPVHPQNKEMTRVAMISITEPVQEQSAGKFAKHCVIVPPGRCDRSPCGTGTSARMAVLHARGQLNTGEAFTHRSIIGSEFVGRIERTTKVSALDGIIPSISGRAWITGHKQVLLDPTDPYPEGFRVGDHWVMDNETDT